MTVTAARRAWLTDLPVLLVAVVWGSSYLAAKGVTTSRTVLAVLVLRFAVVLPVLVATGWRRLRAMSGAQVRGAGVLGLILAAVFVLETYGVVHTSATNAGLIISLTMILTPLAESRLRGTRLSPSFLAAAGLSVLGVVLLTQGAGFSAPSLGDLLILGAAVTRTVHVLAMSRMRSVDGADAMSLTTVQLGASMLVFAVLCAAPGTGAAPWAAAAGFGAGDWAWLLYLSVFCTLFAFFVQMWAVRRTSPSRVSLLLGTEPVWAAVTGIALAGDRPGLTGLLGVLLILAGTAWGRTAADGTEPPAPTTTPVTPEPPATAAKPTPPGPDDTRPAPGETRPGLEPAARP
ncbi:DMT family transporter [Streptomyces lavendofoliae]|uniref:Membrane protein n=1 Tax=Streptomyces lavendofoliae TaxID=67314 RepID=A0A918HUH3_9ACTN|nr:DMT family transporter [Streptomyces lavendofoliae]GGU28845.1 membrane protein [Streptomyces lavendofoliae]